MAKPLPPGEKALALQQLLARATQAHQQGQLAEAEGLYLQALQKRPDLFDAQHLLGVLRGQQGRYEEALALVGAALKAKPGAGGALSNYGLILHKLNRHEEALATFDKTVAIFPNDAEAFNNRGNVLSALERYDQALASYDRALTIRPNYAEALNNRGNVLLALQRYNDALASYDVALAARSNNAEALKNRGLALEALARYEEALRSYVRALLIRPDYAEAHYQRGNVLARLKRYEEAVRSYDKAVCLSPDYAEAHDNRGNALAELKRYEEALASHDRALALRPDYAGAFNNRGIALEQLRRYEEALESFDQALLLKPDYAEALGNRGNTLSKLKCFELALTAYDQALTIKADDAEALCNRGSALSALRRHELAAASYEQALAVSPDDGTALCGLAGAALAVCDWRRTAELGRRLADHVREARSPIAPFALLGHCDDPSLLLRCAENFVAQQIPVPPPPLSDGIRARHEKIRVAYLSADFRSHVMAYQVAELFELHDRARFEVIGVSFADDDGSDIRARLIKGFDRFIDVTARADGEVARLLHELEVDIAVDLMGHTLDARTGIFAYRPAPIQVAYLGYPGTSGADFIDYIIADEIVLPFDQQPFYTEKIVQLPECFFVNDSRRVISPTTPARRDAGLPEDGFVFCCFNNTAKIQPAMFDIWMRLLRRVGGSVLWLGQGNSSAPDNLRREAAARGVDPERLIFAGHLPAIEDHLARHRIADLFLDTLPYNAHGTASAALWAGLPVLTCRGKTFAGRVGASLLQAVDLPELVTESLDAYEALALRVAGDASLLGQVRGKLAQHRQSSPLFNGERFCRHLESAYSMMWERWQRGESRQGFRVPALDEG